MLVLSRKVGESIHIGDGIYITLLEIRPSRVRLGISAPSTVRVQREENRRPVEGRPLAEVFSMPVAELA